MSVAINSNNIFKRKYTMSKNEYLDNILSRLKQEKDLLLSKAVLSTLEEFKTDLHKKIKQQSSENDKDAGR